MNVYCVFQTIEIPSFDETGTLDGTEEIDILKAIFLEEEDAKQHIKKFPNLKLHSQLWYAQ